MSGLGRCLNPEAIHRNEAARERASLARPRVLAMAAAPELLAALKDLLDWADHATGCELRRNGNGSCDCPIDRAHAAIAKAEGRES